jgi:hypothetical protein
MDETDIAIINTNDNEDLGNYFSQKEVGEECSMTIRGRLLGLEEGNARISIDDVQIDAYMEEEEVAPPVDPEMVEAAPEEVTGAELLLKQ